MFVAADKVIAHAYRNSYNNMLDFELLVSHMPFYQCVGGPPQV